MPTQKEDLDTLGVVRARGRGSSEFFDSVFIGQYLILNSWVTDPTTTGWGAAEKGRLWYNSTTNVFKYWDGSVIQTLGSGGSSPHDILSAIHSDALAASVVQGDLIVGNATPRWARFAKGTDGHFLKMVSGAPAWSAPSGDGDMYKSVYDTDDDGIVGQAENADTVDNKHASEFLGGDYDTDYRCLLVVK
jgi:hypothetical protein